MALGTDGFGRSDTRASLRRFFEVDRHAIAVAALHALGDKRAGEAMRRYGIDPESAAALAALRPRVGPSRPGVLEPVERPLPESGRGEARFRMVLAVDAYQ